MKKIEKLSLKELKAELRKNNIHIVGSFNKVSRKIKADKFIKDEADQLSEKHKKQLKDVLVKFQNFLAKNGAELV